jgi:hypothetical protein
VENEGARVTGDSFLAMMENTALCPVPVITVFQLDGAPPHFSCCVCVFLGRNFPAHCIGRAGGPYLGPHVLLEEAAEEI